MLTLPSAAFITIRYSHWQGIVSAVVIAASDTFEEFVVDNSHKAIKWFFYSCLRGQQAFPVTSVEPNIVQDAILGGAPLVQCCPLLLDFEGTPTPLQQDKPVSPRQLQLHVSLHNGTKTFIVTGPPKALFSLVMSLRKVRAQSGLEQDTVLSAKTGFFN